MRFVSITSLVFGEIGNSSEAAVTSLALKNICCCACKAVRFCYNFHQSCKTLQPKVVKNFSYEIDCNFCIWKLWKLWPGKKSEFLFCWCTLNKLRLECFHFLIRSGQLAPRSFAPGNNRIQVESNLFVETDRRSSIQPQPRQLQQPPPQPRQFRQPRPRAPQPVARARSRPRAQSPPCDLLCAIARIFGLWRNRVLRSFIEVLFIPDPDSYCQWIN